MAHLITAVDMGSISEQLDIRPGDALVAINGERVIDWVDYQALTAAEQLSIELLRAGEPIVIEFEKDDYEPLGLSFQGDMMGGLRSCCNHCLFCFVDQLPEDTRATMHIKDDDWRTSLMHGSFVTLTNVNDQELQRIIKRRASPLYISVHATEDGLRSELLGTKRGAGLMKQLQKLKDGGISYHLQCVMCPGLNDGTALDRTIADLASLHPAALSLALVPVGLTGFRGKLTQLKQYDGESAAQLIDQTAEWRKHLYREIGTHFVHAADELYVLARHNFPSDAGYEGYPQIDNGVGLCRLLETEFSWAYEDVSLNQAAPAKLIVACGMSAERFLRGLFEAHPIPNVQIEVVPVINAFFGQTVTVSGLVTGSDLIRTLKGMHADKVLITECMLRDGDGVFLDDLTVDAVEMAIGMPVVPVGRSGDDLLEALMGVKLFDDDEGYMIDVI